MPKPDVSQMFLRNIAKQQNTEPATHKKVRKSRLTGVNPRNAGWFNI